MSNKNRLSPLWLALAVVIGIAIGTFYAHHFSGNRLSIINSGSNKLNNLLYIIDDQYVDTIDMADLVEQAMPQILAELDPHSTYISAKDAGDKSVTVDDSVFTGKSLTNEEAMHRLKGPQGTKVKLGILRYGESDLRYVTVTRGEIPMKSVTAAYMLDDETGYIKIKNFGENTYYEVLVALAQLAQEGFHQLTIDLRGNTGGYLQSAVQIANEFLPKNMLIVYTEGRRSPREEFRSDGRGSYQKMPLVVLIDEGSASASEILSGAIQDNDRGTIIGRRSFGKGLVQKPVEFGDGSMMRLTIARYYTPSGRCIQKPYTNGMDKDYEEDLLARYQHGEFFSQDSIKHEGPEYHTGNGRVVYGGGGITPDIFVPEDTTDYTSYYKEASLSVLILQFGYDYTDQNRDKLKEYDDEASLLKYIKKQNLVEQFAQYADKHGLKRRNLMIQKSRRLLEQYIYSRVIYNMLSEEAWLQYLNEDDPAIKETLRIFKADEAFPKSPDLIDKKQKKVSMTYDYRSVHRSYSVIARA